MPFAYQELIVPSVHTEISFVQQDPIVDLESPSFFNIKYASFVVEGLVDVMNVVVQCSHTVKALFCGGRVKFAVVMQVNAVGIEDIETSIWEEFVGSGSCSMVGKFCQQ